MPRADITALQGGKGGKWTVNIPHGKQIYRYELLDGGDARVFKFPNDVEPVYTIKDGVCSCPAAAHMKACKHIKAVIYSNT